MASFDHVSHALAQGFGVRREFWAPDVRLFVVKGSLMYHKGVLKPWRCALSWEEIAATDWVILNSASVPSHLDRNSTVSFSDSRMSEPVIHDFFEEHARLRSSPYIFRKNASLDS